MAKKSTRKKTGIYHSWIMGFLDFRNEQTHKSPSLATEPYFRFSQRLAVFMATP